MIAVQQPPARKGDKQQQSNPADPRPLNSRRTRLPACSTLTAAPVHACACRPPHPFFSAMTVIGHVLALLGGFKACLHPLE